MTPRALLKNKTFYFEDRNGVFERLFIEVINKNRVSTPLDLTFKK
jgi:hypothetical protein